MYEAGVIDILDPVTDQVVDRCSGPTMAGCCPKAGRDGVVGCHGCRVSGRSAGPEFWYLWVPPGSQHCPRAWKLESVGY